MEMNQISKSALQRLPAYITYLKSLPADAPDHISATTIAAALGLGEVQVRKDLAAVTSGGKPKVGYRVDTLISELDHYLGLNVLTEAVLVGCGKMGSAILDYKSFSQYGLKIVAGFDTNPMLQGTTPQGKKILPTSKLKGVFSRNRIRLAVIAVPEDQAQAVCDELVSYGIKGILNITPVHLNVPADVVVRYENLAIELALLSGQVDARFHQKHPAK